MTAADLLKTIAFALETAFSSKLAPITLPGPDGHPVLLGSLWASAPAVVVFLRHYG